MKVIVIGLGIFGRVLVEELSALGHEVIAADTGAGNIEKAKDKCTAAFQIDATDELALSILPLKTVDVVIVAIGENIGASLRVIALLKKFKVQHIYARAIDSVHENILQAFNVDKIFNPEEEAAKAMVRQMDVGVKVSLFRIDKDYCIFKFKVPASFVGHTPNELNLNMEFRLKIISIVKSGHAQNCLGIEYNQSVVAEVTESEAPLDANDELVCYGKESDFRKLCRAL